MWMLKNTHVKIIEKDTNSSQKKQICATVSVLLLFKLFPLFSTTLPPPLPSLHTSGAQAGSCHGNKQASQQCCMSLCWEGGLGGGSGFSWACCGRSNSATIPGHPQPPSVSCDWAQLTSSEKKKEKEKKSIPPHSPCSSLPSRLGHPMKTQRRASKKLIYWHLVAEN